ncbi:hypothetical protein JOC77_002522 [Peribacillus deserti]|uniref:Uncharacterized protein n=1 Tax=Peribacillus deserti TaxID=673318 RepID=A0ABS2QKU2_9BACI|nr:hypothetical protein [Peribacillus deserti]MBM7693083.1 hypothetical protein [Peribacillus deserti]
MEGLYYINERITIQGLDKTLSTHTQVNGIRKYISENNLQTIKLNPYQIKDYYTILHALLYDLEKNGTRFEFLLFYSDDAVAKFRYHYPEKWEQLGLYFRYFITANS